MDILFHFSAMLESGQVWTLAFVPLFVIRSRRSISLFLLVKNRFVYRSPLSLSSKMILNINSERFISRNGAWCIYENGSFVASSTRYFL